MKTQTEKLLAWIIPITATLGGVGLLAFTMPTTNNAQTQPMTNEVVIATNEVAQSDVILTKKTKSASRIIGATILIGLLAVLMFVLTIVIPIIMIVCIYLILTFLFIALGAISVLLTKK